MPGVHGPKRLLLGALAAVVLALCPLPSASADAPYDTQSDVDAVLAPGGDASLPSSVPTAVIPPDPDVLLLADTTSSMGGPIGAIRRGAADILSTVLDAQPSARFGVAEYRDLQADPVPFGVDQPLTASPGAVAAGIQRWVAYGGGDVPEDGLNALYRLATSDGGFDRSGTRTVVWIGDAPSHDPSGGHTLRETIAALRAADIRVLAVDAGSSDGTGSDGAGLDGDGQAGAVAAATGGVLLRGTDPGAISAAILSGISAVHVTVTPRIAHCDPELSLSLSPSHRGVLSGHPAEFTEHVSVASGAEPGDYACTVSYLVNGRPSGRSDTTTIRVRGISIDDVTVTEGTGGHTDAGFTLSLTGAATAPVSVSYATAAGSASIPADLAYAGGTITFPPGVTDERVVVRIDPDAQDEPREMYTVNLSDPHGAGIADAVGIGTIVDDD